MAHNPPLRATAYEFYLSLVSQSNTKVFQNNPTLAAGDVKVSKDGGSLGNVATLPSAVGSGKVVKVALSAGEMTADNVTVIFSDAAGSEWCDLVVNIQPVNVSIPAAVKSMDANTVTASALAADAVTEIAAAVPTAGGIADAVWDEALSGHTAAGSAGKALGDAQSGVYIGGSTAAATNAARGFQGLVLGTAVTGTLTATAFTTSLTEATNDHYNGRTLTFTSGALAGQMTTIVDYNGGTKLVTVAAMTEAPGNGDQFFIA